MCFFIRRMIQKYGLWCASGYEIRSDNCKNQSIVVEWIISLNLQIKNSFNNRVGREGGNEVGCLVFVVKGMIPVESRVILFDILK